MNKNYIPLIIKAGLVTGSLDILFAFANAWWSPGISPERVLQFIASGLMGKSAFQSLPAIAFLGLAIHYFIAFCWTVLFFFVYPTLKNIIRNKFLQAVLYGLFIWLVMNLLILPVTRTPQQTFYWPDAFKGAAILIIAVGLPLAYFAQKYNKEDGHNQSNNE